MAMLESVVVVSVVDGSQVAMPPDDAIDLVLGNPSDYRIEPPYGAAGHLETALLDAYRTAASQPAATFTEMLSGLQGLPGPPGPAGPAGVGPEGPEGPAGPVGPEGPDGPAGPVGPAGAGVTYKGVVATTALLPLSGNVQGNSWTVTANYHRYVWGIPASSGVLADWKDDGPAGTTGPQGPKGDEGDPGAKGDRGDQGTQGLKGDKGDQGVQGVQGLKGAKGDQGTPGTNGLPGAPGAPGAPGTNGTNGLPGAPGAPGEDGEDGAPGAPGPTGPAGAGITYKGVVNTNAELPVSGNTLGDSYTTKVTPPNIRWVWNGAWVNDGPAGSTGPIGPQGIPGIPGTPGTNGTNGAPGAPGAKGDKGDKGDQGLPGTPGAKGDDGDPGPPGADGEDGANGAPGATGPQGPAGSGITYKGVKATTSALPLGPSPPNVLGDCYTVTANNHRYVWNIPASSGTLANWADDGPAGTKGDKGDPGSPTAKASAGQADDASSVSAYVDPALVKRTAVIHTRGNWDFSRIDTAGAAAAGWIVTAGSGWTPTIVNLADRWGGHAVRIGNASGQLYAGIASADLEPIDITKTYSMEVYVRVNDDAPNFKIYAGLRCYDRNEDLIPIYSNRWFAANGVAGMQPPDRRVFSGVISGHASAPAVNQFPDGTVYVRRQVQINVDSAHAEIDVEYCQLREIEHSPLLACRDFGLDPSAGQNAAWNADALQAMLTHLKTYGGHGHIEKRGIYDIGRTITTTGSTLGFVLTGLGRATTLRRAFGGTGYFLDFQTCDNFEVRDLVLDGNLQASTSGSHTLAVHDCSNVLLKRVRVQYSAGTGIYASCDPDFGTDTNIVIDQCSVVQTGDNGILVSRMYNCAITNCFVENIGVVNGAGYTPGYGIQLKEGNRRAIITGNTVKHTMAAGIMIKGGGDDNGDPQQLLHWCIVSNNYVEAGSTTTHQGLFRFQECRSISAVGNIANCNNQMGPNSGIPAFLLSGCQRSYIEGIVMDVPETLSQNLNTSNNRALKLEKSEYYPDGVTYNLLPTENNYIQLSQLHNVGTRPFHFKSNTQKNKIRIGQITGNATAPGPVPASYVLDESGSSAGSNSVYYL